VLLLLLLLLLVEDKRLTGKRLGQKLDL